MSGESILVGCDDGSVHIIGENVPNRVVGLFELDGPASALSGWPRFTHSARLGKKSSFLEGRERSITCLIPFPRVAMVALRQENMLFLQV